jgi:hypothetical protein
MNKTIVLKTLALPMLLIAFGGATTVALAAESAVATAATTAAVTPTAATPTAVTTTSAPATTNADNGKSNADNGKSNANKSRVQNGKGTIMGNLETRQHVYYVGDSLDIQVQFARGADLLAKGEADAHIVIFSADGTVFSVPVPADVGTSSRKFFPVKSIDIATLPAGQYQLALVLTTPKGDPKLVNNWYSGFRALLDSEAIYISDTSVSGDANKDGEWDDDADGDGIVGEEDDDKGMHGKKK